MSFVHLHTHSEGSLLDGMAKVKDLAKTAASLGMPALAITDHGTLYNAVQHVSQCAEAGINGIVGCELYCAPKGRGLRQPIDGENYYHLLALAKNEAGYRNLCRLVSRAYAEGFYYKPRVDKELLAEYREGLIITSACLGGEMATFIMKDRVDAARSTAIELRDVFGEDFFIELQDHGLDRQQQVNWHLWEIAQAEKIPIIGTNDVHYLREEDAAPHEVLLCVQTQKTWSDPKRMRYGPAAFYLKSPAEMAATSLSGYPGVLERTVEVAERCKFTFAKGAMHVPQYAVPEGHTPESYLEQLCRAALPAKYPEADEALEARLRYELDLIQRKGYSTYFLIVWDLVAFARGQGIMSQARGSAAGSVVSYLLGLSLVDPMRYHLLFDRFLNADRKSLPDIDMDFADTRREEVFQYCRQKYGEEHVARIIAFSTMAARAAVRDAGRVLEYAPNEVSGITRLISTKPHTTLKGSLEGTSELREMHEKDERVRTLYDTALRLEGLYRSASVHAAGVVITPEPVSTYVPVQRMSDDAGTLAIQYEMEDAEKIGLLKMDCLALRNLTVADQCLRSIAAGRDEQLRLEDLPHDDPATFRLLQAGETIGVFQFESGGMQHLLRGIRPDRMEDLIAAVALFRPGPLESGMVESYVKRKHGREAVTYDHPLLEPILRDTYGMIVYQEQVMKITMSLAGFSPGESEAAMKAMGKKKLEEMEKLEPRFKEGCAGNDIPAELAGSIFQVMVNFASYGFNMAHSAAYALLGYHTAYLKAHYPQEFMAANLSTLVDKKERLALYVSDVRRMGIPVLPPCVQRSRMDFVPEGSGIRVGLQAILGVNELCAGAVRRAREEGGAFRGLGDFLGRVGEDTAISKAALEGLMKSGALDDLPGSRAQFLAVLDQAGSIAASLKKARKPGQDSLFGGDDVPTEVDLPLPAVPSLAGPALLDYEREALGFYVSSHPVEQAGPALRKRGCLPAGSIADLQDGDRVTVGGIVARVTERKTKAGAMMAQVVLEDPSGTVSVTLFPDAYSTYRAVLTLGTLLVVQGRAKTRGEGDDAKAEVQVNELQRVDQAGPAHAAGRLDLRLPSGVPESVLTVLARLLAGAPGGCPVVLIIGTSRLQLPISVNPEHDMVTQACRDVQRAGGEADFAEAEVPRAR
jgi:DNA polymerase-3 subunit alpha